MVEQRARVAIDVKNTAAIEVNDSHRGRVQPQLPQCRIPMVHFEECVRRHEVILVERSVL